jgi:hypothetical protein
MMEILGRSTTLASTYDSDKFMSEVIKATLNALHVVAPSQVAGTIARYHVSGQSNSRTRIEFPSGAKAIRIFYSARRIDGAETADGIGLKVVLNIANPTTAGNALGESAGTAGTTISGVSYLFIPINSSYEAAFPDPTDRLYYIDFLTAASEAGGSDVIVEVTL